MTTIGEFSQLHRDTPSELRLDFMPSKDGAKAFAAVQDNIVHHLSLHPCSTLQRMSLGFFLGGWSFFSSCFLFFFFLKICFWIFYWSFFSKAFWGWSFCVFLVHSLCCLFFFVDSFFFWCGGVFFLGEEEFFWGGREVFRGRCLL